MASPADKWTLKRSIIANGEYTRKRLCGSTVFFLAIETNPRIDNEYTMNYDKNNTNGYEEGGNRYGTVKYAN